MFYHSTLRLRLENSFHLCHYIHFYIFSHPVMVSLFLSQHNGVFPPSTLFIFNFWVSSLPMSVTIHLNCCLHTNYFAEQSYCRHIYPLGSLLLDSSSAVAMTPYMATDIAVTPHLYPLVLLPASHLSKFVLDHYTTVTR